MNMCLPTSVSNTAVLVLLALDYASCQSIQTRQNIAHIATIQAWPSVDPVTAVDHRATRQLVKLSKSLDAINKLLKHSVNGPSVGAAGAMVKYVKIGNLDTAVKDFYSVKPIVSGLPASGIYKKKGKVLLGHVGEHRVRLVEKGTADGRFPVLEFTNTKNTHLGPGVLRIIYKTEDVD